MGNHKRWVQRGGGNFRKWETPGQSVEGVWKGTRDGKFGPLATIEVEGEGGVTVPLQTALLLMVESAGINEGDEVKIVYKGMEKNPKSGRDFKAFELYVAEPDTGELEEAKGGPERGPDDDIPF